MPGSILITPEVLRLAEGYVQVTSLGPVAIKGLSTPVEVYEVLGAGPVRSRLQAAAMRGLTRFVGRAPGTGEPRPGPGTGRQRPRSGGGAHGRAGDGQVPPGRGIHPLLSHTGVGGVESRSVSYGKATPYLPVIDLLKAYCGIEPATTPRRMREKVPASVRARRGAGADPSADPGAAGGASGRCGLARARPPATPPAYPGGRQAPTAAGEPGAAAAAWSSKTCTGSIPRRRQSWTAWWRACRRPGSYCWSTTVRSTSTAGGQDVLHPTAPRPPTPGERGRALAGPAGG